MVLRYAAALPLRDGHVSYSDADRQALSDSPSTDAPTVRRLYACVT